MKNYRQLIHEDIRNLGIADNFLGEECLYLALDILKDNSMRLCCISKSMYFDMADAMDTTTICIERNLRTFIAKLWKTDNHRYLDKIAGRHLVSKPTKKAFLDMMRLLFAAGGCFCPIYLECTVQLNKGQPRKSSWMCDSKTDGK